MQTPQVGGDQTFEPGEAVMSAVGVEIGVKLGDHRDAQLARRSDGRGAQRSFGDDLHHVRPIGVPLAAKQSRCRQAESESGVAGNRQAAYQRGCRFRCDGGFVSACWRGRVRLTRWPRAIRPCTMRPSVMATPFTSGG